MGFNIDRICIVLKNGQHFRGHLTFDVPLGPKPQYSISQSNPRTLGKNSYSTPLARADWQVHCALLTESTPDDHGSTPAISGEFPPEGGRICVQKLVFKFRFISCLYTSFWQRHRSFSVILTNVGLIFKDHQRHIWQDLWPFALPHNIGGGGGGGGGGVVAVFSWQYY
eukprot:COSAG02_NODE_582_length_20017_cov_26.599608_6_plen_168_part_00